MATTPNLLLPYPEPSSSVDVPRDIKALADAIDALTTLRPPTVQLRQSVAQSIPAGSPTGLLFDIEELDTHGMHSTASQTSRIIPPVAGWYRVAGSVTYVAGTTNRRGANWAVNGVAIYGTINNPMLASITIVDAPNVLVKLNVGDYLELQGYQDTSAALSTFVTAPNRPWATVQLAYPYT